MAVLLLLLAAAAACGAPNTARRRARGEEDFVCNQRRAEYVLVGGFVAAESGVTVECESGGPRLIRWTLAEGASERKQSSHPLAGADFDDIWQQLDDAGWRNLGDCDNPNAADGDPVYTFDIADYGSRVTLTCPGKELPFPYDRLLNALDLKAAEVGGE